MLLQEAGNLVLDHVPCPMPNGAALALFLVVDRVAAASREAKARRALARRSI